jgi:hypothetical protein
MPFITGGCHAGAGPENPGRTQTFFNFSLPRSPETPSDVTLIFIMDVQELLVHLDRHCGSFPKELVAEAILRREEIIPEFLSVLEDIDRNPEPWLANDERMVHIYALYLLALFRETRAYPLLVRIFSRPGEFPFELAGDVVTQDLGRILASVSGGEINGMVALIENESVNEWVRAVAMDSIVSLVTIGQRTRDEAMTYFLQLFHKLKRKPGAQWCGLANVCADLWPQEAIGELRRAYEEGLVDPWSIEWEDIEDALAQGWQGTPQRSYREPLITDLAKNMTWMQCFHPKKREKQPEYKREAGDGELLGSPANKYVTTILRTHPKVGRNQPCPCGSGKKFKKCCEPQ